MTTPFKSPPARTPPLKIEVYRCPDAPTARLPVFGSTQAVGADVYSYNISESGRAMQVMIPPGGTRAVRTGLIVTPPHGYWITLSSRSGLTMRVNPLMVANAPAVIDPDYRGELMVLLYNGGQQAVTVAHDERIAQLYLHEVVHFEFRVSDKPPEETPRGSAGLGSTGTGPIKGAK